MTAIQCLGKKTCQERGWDFSEVFRFQFKLTTESGSLCLDWGAEQIGRWYLHHCPDLPCSELLGQNGARVGVVLGYAVDRDGVLLQTRESPLRFGSLPELESYIEGMAGRFIALVCAFEVERVYFDPTAGLSAVFSNAGVASCVHLLVDRDIIPEPAVDISDVQERRAQFLLGETCDAECQRVRGNHFIDLSSMALRRHWPKAVISVEDGRQTREQAAAEISARLAQIIQALAQGTSVALPLSSGTDSRILLAASMGVLDHIDSFYVHDIYSVTRFDRQGARILSDYVGVDLTVIDAKSDEFKQAMTQEEEDDLRRKMAVRTSLGFDGIDGPTVRAVSLAPQTALVLRGNVAEMTRANKWTHATARKGATSKDGLAALLNMRAEHLEERVAPERLASLSERYDAWVETLPEEARTRIPDLAHAEVFMPGAPNNVYYAFTRNFYINPFNDRHLLQWTSWFHPLARRRRKLVNKIIAKTAPELATLPYLKDLKLQEKKPA